MVAVTIFIIEVSAITVAEILPVMIAEVPSVIPLTVTRAIAVVFNNDRALNDKRSLNNHGPFDYQGPFHHDPLVNDDRPFDYNLLSDDRSIVLVVFVRTSSIVVPRP